MAAPSLNGVAWREYSMLDTVHMSPFYFPCGTDRILLFSRSTSHRIDHQLSGLTLDSKSYGQLPKPFLDATLLNSDVSIKRLH